MRDRTFSITLRQVNNFQLASFGTRIKGPKSCLCIFYSPLFFKSEAAAERRQIVILVRRTTHEQPITAHQHNHRQPTTNAQSQEQQQQQPQLQQGNSGNTQHQATKSTTVPSSCVPERTLSRVDARACAQTKVVGSSNKSNPIWGGSVLTGEEPPPHSRELNHALSQVVGPTQSKLSRPMSSGHHISMEHRLRRKHLQLNSDTDVSIEIYGKEIQTFLLRKKKWKKEKFKNDIGVTLGWAIP